MEYDERLALFRQTRLNPFDRGEEEDGPQAGKTPPQHGKLWQSLHRLHTLRSPKTESDPCTLRYYLPSSLEDIGQLLSGMRWPHVEELKQGGIDLYLTQHLMGFFYFLWVRVSLFHFFI